MSDLQRSLRTIHDWIAAHDPTELAAAVANLRADAPLLPAVDTLVAAADSRDEERCQAGIAALFGGLVEYCNDSLLAGHRAVYSRCFCRAVWTSAKQDPVLRAALSEHGLNDETALWQRHQSLRTQPQRAPTLAGRILVLSRVTIGADILLTTVLLQHIRQAWPAAEIVVVGSPKLNGLIGGFSGLRIAPLHYARRGTLRSRLRAWLGLRELVAAEAPDVVLAPDSRLDQLGILPLVADARYLLWENTMPATGPESLATLIDRWCGEWLPNSRTVTCHPKLYLDDATHIKKLRLRQALGTAPLAAVKFDHGGNPAKALPRAAEVALLAALRAKGWRILIDRGFGADEYAHSDALLKDADLQAIDIDDADADRGLAVHDLDDGQLASAPVIRFHGSIAGWCAALACCRLALSYDSVGQHLAAASGVPAIVPFCGYTQPHFPIAWAPHGHAPIRIHRFANEDAKHDPALLRAILDDIPDGR